MAGRTRRTLRRSIRAIPLPGAGEDTRRRRRRERLLRVLPRNSVGCEIGVWMGDFSAKLVETVEPRELHLVDPWAFNARPEYSSALFGGVIARSQADMDRIYEQVVERFGQRVDAGQIVIHRAQSSEALERFRDESLDWVYIDGDHLYEYVRADLFGYAAKVRRGGLICGDDYSSPGWWDDGVRLAVDEFIVSRPDVTPILLAEQFVLKRRQSSWEPAKTLALRLRARFG